MTTTFVWDANQTQIYSADYGNQSLKSDTFSKVAPAGLIVDAPKCELTLTTNNNFAWGSGSQNQKDVSYIEIKEGTLTCNGDFVTGNASFIVAGKLNITGDEFKFMGLPTENVNVVNLIGNGKLNLKTKTILTQNKLTFHAYDFSEMVVDFDKLPDEVPVFVLGTSENNVPNEAEFLFENTNKSFQFAQNNPFTEGTFYFDTTGGKNLGKFVFNNCGNTIDFNAMIQNKLVSINGNTDPSYVLKNIKKNNYLDGKLIVELIDNFA